MVLQAPAQQEWSYEKTDAGFTKTHARRAGETVVDIKASPSRHLRFHLRTWRGPEGERGQVHPKEQISSRVVSIPNARRTRF